MKLTMKDNDDDLKSDGNCAVDQVGNAGRWYRSCSHTYMTQPTTQRPWCIEGLFPELCRNEN